MPPQLQKSTDLLQALESLRQEIHLLGQRVAALEADHPKHGSKPMTSSVQPNQALDEELVLTISAAIAAYLGVQPHIRQIRLIGGASWAQQGRVTIQASHSLAGTTFGHAR